MLERIFHQLFRTERGLLTVFLTDYLVIVTKSRTKTPCTKPFYVNVRVSTNLVRTYSSISSHITSRLKPFVITTELFTLIFH